MTENIFEKNIERLEDIVKKLEDGSCSLDESIKLFEEGIKLSGECNKTLSNAKQKITLLTDAENEEKI